MANLASVIILTNGLIRLMWLMFPKWLIWESHVSHADHLAAATARYFYDTFAYGICFYGIYFYGIYIYVIYFYTALKFLNIDLLL